MCGTLEIHVEVLCKVPSEGELTVPQELFAEGERQFGIHTVLHIALLKLVIGASHVGIERDVLRQIVQA